MFRLIKLAMYGFIGYSLYQLYQGMMQQQQGGGGGSAFGGAGGGFPGSRTQDYNASNQGGGQNLTGGGTGRTESTLDNDGGSVGHNVGRGVIST